MILQRTSEHQFIVRMKPGTSMKTQGFNKQVSWLIPLWRIYPNPTYCSPVALAAFISWGSRSDAGYHLCNALGGCDSWRRCFWAFPTCTVTLWARVCCCPSTAHVFLTGSRERGSVSACSGARGKDKDGRLETTAFLCRAENLQLCGSKQPGDSWWWIFAFNWIFSSLEDPSCTP